MLSLRNHRLVGDAVAFRATPNVGGSLKPRYLVSRSTAGSSAASSIESLCTKKPQGNVAAHVVLARADDEPPRYVVNIDGLNIRRGPDAAFDAVAPPLPRGTLLRLVQAGSRWSQVEVDGPTDVQGWVNNRFIVRVQDAPRSLLPHARTAASNAAKKPARGSAR